MSYFGGLVMLYHSLTHKEYKCILYFMISFTCTGQVFLNEINASLNISEISA